VRSLGKKISGAATIIGDLVFVSDLDKRTTWALGARTGRTVWKTHRGGFNPAISDGRRVYFTGYSSLFALDPKGRPFSGRTSASTRRLARAERAAARKRSARRARARARARRARQLRFRFAPHGHRHSAKVGYGRSCHLHKHVYKVGRKTIVLRHNHCHSHIRRR
jgi:hypothetical protein